MPSGTPAPSRLRSQPRTRRGRRERARRRPRRRVADRARPSAAADPEPPRPCLRRPRSRPDGAPGPGRPANRAAPRSRRSSGSAATVPGSPPAAAACARWLPWSRAPHPRRPLPSRSRAALGARATRRHRAHRSSPRSAPAFEARVGLRRAARPDRGAVAGRARARGYGVRVTARRASRIPSVDSCGSAGLDVAAFEENRASTQSAPARASVITTVTASGSSAGASAM